ncbi:MAG: hypothetical protein J6V72_19685, partial [Kiritimatiellae bacterium]|nr:hypothetical protein [Kiritimatiellia bacterium]
MSAPEQTGTWITESGSPYLRRAGAAHDLTPGCSVTGDGIPAGAFLKRIFADDLIEISDAATASSGAGGAELVFGAFNPTTLQHVESLANQGGESAQVVFYFTKFRAHDEFRVVVTNLLSSSGYSNHKIVFDTDTSSANCFATNKTYYPGTVVLHNTPSHYRTTLVLNEAHVEFAGTNGTASGGINLLNINGNARIAVSNGVEATVHRLVAWGGSLVKEGAGTLVVNSTNATHHALSVEGGTFVFNATYHDGTATLDSLAVADGATFRLVAGSTLKVVAAPTLASGARIVIEEGARLILPGSYVPSSGVTFDGAGTLISACSAGGLNGGPIRATPPVGTVVGNPAFWVTAESLTNAVPSGTIVAENGTNFVTRLNDCRGGADQGYHFCTNVYNRPWLVTSGSVPYIQFKTGTSGGSESENNYGLAWDVPLTNIRVVFAVLSSPSSGMGCLLGATKRLTPCDYLRGSTSSGSNLFYWNANGNCSSPDVYNAPIYRNGIEIKYNSNYNGCSDTTVVEVDSLADTSADAFSICQSVKWGKRWDLCGGRLVEYIIYTNVLTYAERLQVSDYLMR